MEKMDGMTMNNEQANVEKLKEVFPEVFADGKVDFYKLQRLLGNYIADDKERYSFSWKGKADSLRLAQKRSTGTLRPCKEESKNWDTTENFYIEGDNLEVYKLDRFSRNKYEMAMYKKQLKDNGTKVLSATEFIPDTPEGIIFESMLEGYEHSNGHNKKSNMD